MSKVKKTPNRQFPQLLLIEASAGSGKTHALSRRYVEFLLADDVPHNRLPNLLAITFTKNAAREMKERILGWLKGLALGTDPAMMAEMRGLLGLAPEEISKRAGSMVDEVIEHYSDFQVQTIDSFTNRLARASARELGFRPDFETAMTYQGLVDYALALLAAGIGPGRDGELTSVMDEFLEVLNAGSKSFAWDPQGRMRDSFAGLLGIESKETGRFAYADQRPAIDRLWGELRDVYGRVEALARDNGLPFRGDENLLKYIEGRDIAKILGRKTYNDRNTPWVKGELKKSQHGFHDRSKEIWGQSGPIVAGLAAAYAIARYAAFHLPYGRFKARLGEAKERLGIVHIDDIALRLSSHLAREIIPEVYLKLGARIHHYLVDEFQDTDPAQWRSLMPLLEEALASDGSAFMVGDLKQAIYMFRQADYRIMKGLREEIEGKAPGKWLPASVEGRAAIEHLGHNFRCGEVIVDYVAGTFREVLPGLIGRGFYLADRTGLTAYRQEPSQGNRKRGYVEVRRFQKPGRDEAGGEEAEGPELSPVRAALLEIIGDAHGRGYPYREMAVLARTNRELEQAIDWLNQAKIPATSSSGLDIRQRRLIGEILALLRWLDSPIDNVAWAGVVNGRMLLRAARRDGFDWDGEKATGLLFEAGQLTGRNGYLFRECRRAPSFAGLWERYLAELYRLSGFSPAYDLVCLAVERFGVMANFPEEAAAVVQFLEAVNRLEAEGVTSIGDLLEKSVEGEPEIFGLELPENMEAVQLLTFFKAKGMGFPVVVNLFSDFKPRSPDFHYGKSGEDITLYAIDKNSAERTAGFPADLSAIREECEADARVQELNSLYVACTRARDELYNLVSFGPPDKKGAPSRYFLLFPEFRKGDKGRGRGAGRMPEPMSPWPAFARPGEHWRPEAAWTRGRFSDARLGECLHRVLEGLDRLPADFGRTLEEALKRHRHMAPRADPGAMAGQLAGFLKNPKVAGWFAEAPGRSVEREIEFIGRDGRLLRMDRVVRDPEGVTVLDFKTGAGTGSSRARHREQMGEYLEVLAESFPGKRLLGLVCYLDGTVAEVRP